MFTNYLKKKAKQRRKYLKCYETGMKIANKFKNLEIAALKLKHRKEIKEKEILIHKKNDRIKRIEKDIIFYESLINRTTSVIKNAHNNSYAKNMVANNEHKEIKSLLQEMELIGIGFDKKNKKTGKKFNTYKQISPDYFEEIENARVEKIEIIQRPEEDDTIDNK